MDTHYLNILLEKEASGALSQSERNELETWYHAFDEQTVKDFLAVYPEKKELLRKEILAGLLQKIGVNEVIEKNTSTISPKIIHFKLWRVAAAVVILLVGVWIGHHLDQTDRTGIRKFLTTETQKGQRSMVLLSDGSKVFLNSDSRLIYPVTLKEDRVVCLEGEAFFEVPNDKKPLIIRTSNLVTTVKASQFNISAFPRDSTITVAVKNGAAKVSSDSKTFPLLSLRFPGKKDTIKPKVIPMAALQPALMKLRPVKVAEVKADEYITYNKDERTADIFKGLNPKALFGWKDGIIYFHDADTSELIKGLERWYGITISLNTKGLSLPKFSGEFDNENMINVIQSISNHYNLDYTIAGKTVYLNRRLD